MSNDIMKSRRISFSAIISTDRYRRAISNTLRDPAREKRFVAAITSAVAVNPALQDCDPSAVLSGALLGEGLNLSPSPQLGQYYLVPFENRKKGCKDAQFVLGYKGMIQLALRSGQYKRLNVLSVKEGELLAWNPLTEENRLKLIEDDTEREQTATVGYLASFEYLNGFTKTIYWSKKKMLAHADRYSQAFSIEAQTINTRSGKSYHRVSFDDYEAHNYPQKDEWLYSSFWYKDFDGMAHKTMLRQLISKWGIMSVDMQSALDMDGTVCQEDGGYVHVEDTDILPAEIPEAGGIEAAIEAPESSTQQEEQVSLSDV